MAPQLGAAIQLVISMTVMSSMGAFTAVSPPGQPFAAVIDGGSLPQGGSGALVWGPAVT